LFLAEICPQFKDESVSGKVFDPKWSFVKSIPVAARPRPWLRSRTRERGLSQLRRRRHLESGKSYKIRQNSNHSHDKGAGGYTPVDSIYVSVSAICNLQAKLAKWSKIKL
jgi:hypothetical protein